MRALIFIDVTDGRPAATWQKAENPIFGKENGVCLLGS
jgi:hypothetical protein